MSTWYSKLPRQSSDGHRKMGNHKRQLPGAFAPFMSVSFTSEGETHIVENKARRGDYLDLDAQMDLLVAISNCPQNLIR